MSKSFLVICRKHGSPRAARSNYEVKKLRKTIPYDPDSKEGTPKKCKQCNCKNSRCLKLYDIMSLFLLVVAASSGLLQQTV